MPYPVNPDIAQFRQNSAIDFKDFNQIEGRFAWQ
jgi:hypothetical protein